jgi:hypothetical protein
MCHDCFLFYLSIYRFSNRDDGGWAMMASGPLPAWVATFNAQNRGDNDLRSQD